MMSSHFDLVLESPNANLVAGMRWLQSAYTIRLNPRHKLFGREAESARRRKSDPGKLAIAARVRRETTLPVRWIAARLRLGTRESANTLLIKWMRENKTTVG